MFRYVFTYCHPIYNCEYNYNTVFSELKDAKLFLKSAVWHLSAKCREGFQIGSIHMEKQHKDKVWRNYLGN